ncbi:Chymotrypsin-2 [Eumeta japonica]|uniref:Chymotrypsin-2 n=1 Tax=Eumeta variegata TaxID=151549 RepID=A0A4C1T0N4_EUMVA|nr:Chymotrypsin-2 [Eumeta japonica]
MRNVSERFFTATEFRPTAFLTSVLSYEAPPLYHIINGSRNVQIDPLDALTAGAEMLIEVNQTNFQILRIDSLQSLRPKEPNGESSRQMQALSLPVFSQDTCKYAMRYNREVFDTMFCTFTRIGEGTCHGDSGGPLVKGDKLAGLVSWGLPCAVGFPDVHTRISPYVEWIQKLLKKNEYKKKKRKPRRATRIRVSVLVNNK